MSEMKIPTLFNVSVYEISGKLTETLSKARVRIFYKGENRNASFITDEFAEQLILTLPYAPIKGVYDEVLQDFTDHAGGDYTAGRAYGVVPQETNFAWEDHEDPDGVVRTYACCDVILWTAIYPEALKIVGAPQSMELYEPSVKGVWEVINGKRLYKFTEGCFLGLQALGENVEPAFEGASFYTFMNTFSSMFSELERIYNDKKIKGGDDNTMSLPSFKFTLSNEDKRSKIWTLLNPEEEISYWIAATFENYVIAQDAKDDKFYRFDIAFDESENVSLVGDKVEVFREFLTLEEKTARTSFSTTHEVTTLEDIENKFSALTESAEVATKAKEALFALLDAEDVTEENSIFELIEKVKTNFDQLGVKVEELNTALSTLQTEKGNLEGQLEVLTTYQKENEDSKKLVVFTNFEKLVPEDVLKEYQENQDSYSVVDLEKELSYEAMKSNPSVFSLGGNKGTNGKQPKDQALTGLEALLENYK